MKTHTENVKRGWVFDSQGAKPLLQREIEKCGRGKAQMPSRGRDQDSVGVLKELDLRTSAQVDRHSINLSTQNMHSHRSELPPLQMHSVKLLRPQETRCQAKTQDRGTVKDKEKGRKIKRARKRKEDWEKKIKY